MKYKEYFTRHRTAVIVCSFCFATDDVTFRTQDDVAYRRFVERLFSSVTLKVSILVTERQCFRLDF